MSKDKEPYQLPEGWIWTTLGELGVVVSGGTPSTKNPQLWGGEIIWITPADLSSFKEKFISKGKRNISSLGLTHSSAILLPKNTLLFSSRAPIGYVVIAQEELATNQGFKNLIPMKSTYIDYLYYYLKASKQLIEKMASGTTFLELSASKFSQIPVPLPSISEQRRIVEKIEELFSELDKSIQNLEKAKKQLDVYQQVLLSNAFGGKLTEKWRKNNYLESVDELLESINSEKKQRYKETIEEWKKLVKVWEANGKKEKKPIKPSKPIEFNQIQKNDMAKLPSIPQEWKWVRNNVLLYYITSGSRDWKKYYSNNGAYFIRTQDIKTNKLELKNIAYVNLPLNVEGKRSLVEKGDLLMTITGANVGRVAYMKDDIQEAYVSQSVALMKPVNADIIPYLHLYFQSAQYGGKLMNDLVYGVGRPVLSLENMREAPVALCSLEEQKEIVSIIESETSIIENLKNSITNSILQCKILHQNILKKSFEGKLTEQNIIESASDLLKKITLEKEVFIQKEKLNRQTTKKPKMDQEKGTIIDILQERNSPLSAKELWQLSIYNDNIDAFYSELKKYIESGVIEELPRQGKESILKLAR